VAKLGTYGLFSFPGKKTKMVPRGKYTKKQVANYIEVMEHVPPDTSDYSLVP
jgi:hypothetical protein